MTTTEWKVRERGPKRAPSRAVSPAYAARLKSPSYYLKDGTYTQVVSLAPWGRRYVWVKLADGREFPMPRERDLWRP